MLKLVAQTNYYDKGKIMTKYAKGPESIIMCIIRSEIMAKC